MTSNLLKKIAVYIREDKNPEKRENMGKLSNSRLQLCANVWFNGRR